MNIRLVILCLMMNFAASAQNGPFEATSLLGQKLYGLPDDPEIQTARKNLNADPNNVTLVLKLSKAQAARRQYREAIATCTDGLKSAPNSADLYVERGHRELGLRDFKAALADLTRAVELDPKILDAHYHQGLAYYFLRDFNNAAQSYNHALDLAQTQDSVIDCSNWLYVSLRRAGQSDAAAKVLTRITPDVKNKEPHLYFYLQLLHFYQGGITEAQVMPQKPSDLETELSFNTVSYGVGNWHFYNNEPKRAHELFQPVVAGAAWNSWGFIGSEIELATPLPIVTGGLVIPLYPPDSPLLKSERVHETEQWNMSQTVPGRINSIVNIHNPSIEFHPAERSLNTGAAVILVAGGGHRTLNVGSESADFVPFFYNYGVNCIILRNRLRSDGYNPQTDGVNDALQAVRVVRAHAKEWNLDPNKIGMMGFSAGAELVAAAAVQFDDATGSRPDFAGIIYPGPSPFAKNRAPPPIPHNVPPAFIVCGGSGDKVHAVWATEYFSAMLAASVPNIEMHIYGNGRHPGDPLPDGSHMSGGLTDRGGIPFGTWQFRFMDWFRDLGFLQKPGVETKAAKDIAAYINQK